ncbi:hypothetical protein GCM10009416_02710 [Craurococcus roseus]|uniref:Uncharacterized protein n=1 Tax=Craurococcus roseus TaxID=77585 RepID=A0ABN1EK03_9PROT
MQAQQVERYETWSFTHKAKNMAAKAAPEGTGDVWTWTALDADTKLAVGWLVGGQDAAKTSWSWWKRLKPPKDRRSAALASRASRRRRRPSRRLGCLTQRRRM